MMEKELVIEQWNDRFEKEVKPFFSINNTRSALLASDISWSIRRLKSENKDVTADGVLDKLLGHYHDRWKVLPSHKEIKEKYFDVAVGYYADWEDLTEEQKTPIRDSRKKSYLRSIGELKNDV